MEEQLTHLAQFCVFFYGKQHKSCVMPYYPVYFCRTLNQMLDKMKVAEDELARGKRELSTTTSKLQEQQNLTEQQDHLLQVRSPAVDMHVVISLEHTRTHVSESGIVLFNDYCPCSVTCKQGLHTSLIITVPEFFC